MKRALTLMAAALFGVGLLAASGDFTLSLSSTTGGAVVRPGEGDFSYEHCEHVSLTAKAESGYVFVEWTGDTCSVDDPQAADTFIESIGDNYEIKAVFEPKKRKLHVTSTDGGRVAVPGEGAYYYEHCKKVELQAVADEGYEFVRWTGDTVNIVNTRSARTYIDSMIDDYMIRAVFEPRDHKLTISSTDGGRVTQPGEGNFYYEHCAEVNLRAESESGYRFVKWTGDTEKIVDPYASRTSLDSMVEDYEITAVFERKKYKLTVTSTEGGRVSTPGEGVFDYEHCTQVTLRAEPSSGYWFVEWAGDVDKLDDPASPYTTISMEGDYRIKAVFERKMHVLSVSSTEHGEVEKPGEGVFPYGHGAEVELRAVADSGYRFAGWAGDNNEIPDHTAAETTITMLGSYDIRAVFERKTHDVTLSATEGGEVVAPGAGTFTFEHCTTVEISAEPYCGYRFVKWTGDINEVVDPSSPETRIDSVLEDYEIAAVFERKQQQLVISSTDCGEVTSPGEGVFTKPYCSVVELRVESDCDYRFAGWTGDIDTIADPNSPNTTIDIKGDHEIRAEFARIWRLDLLSFLLGGVVGGLVVLALSG